jgi:hypothetical protein
MNLQEDLMTEAKRLANLGEDYGSIVGQLEANNQLLLKHYVLGLPEELATQTIYGRVAWASRENVPKGRGRPRKN